MPPMPMCEPMIPSSQDLAQRPANIKACSQRERSLLSCSSEDPLKCAFALQPLHSAPYCRLFHVVWAMYSSCRAFSKFLSTFSAMKSLGFSFSHVWAMSAQGRSTHAACSQSATLRLQRLRSAAAVLQDSEVHCLHGRELINHTPLQQLQAVSSSRHSFGRCSLAA